MRISSFELECKFRTHFTLAEVINRQAHAVQLIQIQNVRGDENSWLNLAFFVNGRVVRRKSIRNLRVGDMEGAARYEREIREQVILPDDLAPGVYTLRLEIARDSAVQEILADITVLPPNIIPTDFVRAPLLPAYVQESDLLRNFAAGTVSHLENPDASTVVQCLYEALLDKKLMFQPVGGRQYPDCQRIASMSNVLHNGGCCAELSLLFASLMRNVGLSPALLLYETHMAVGCFPHGIPDFDVLDNPRTILQLVQNGDLLLLEATSVCQLYQHSFQGAQLKIRERLALCIEDECACVLINVRRILRPTFRTVAPDLIRIKCSNCHYVAEVSLLSEELPCCPACKQPLQQPELPEAPAPEPMPASSNIQYGMRQGGAVVLRLTADNEEQIRIADAWDGRSVTEIGERAFHRSRLRSVLMPESVTVIGDYAFHGCPQLKRVVLHDTLTKMGTGAFQNSGLQEITLPGSLSLIPRMAFDGCTELTSVTISDGVVRIDENAFRGCRKLRSVIIPASVRQLYRSAFPPQCELILISRATQIL